MAYAFAKIAFTPTVWDQQDRNGAGAFAIFLSDMRYGGDTLSGFERAFIEGCDGFYQATVSETGWSYVQFRGGPAGFLQTGAGNQDVQLEMFLDYGTNVREYAKWQAMFRDNQPPALIIWGKNDYIFPAEGAHPYLKDLDDVEFHLLDTGHFALEEFGEVIAAEIQDFLPRTRQ